MGKIETHKKDFQDIFQKLLQSKDQNQINKYIIENCCLPGRRANLEMAFAFSDILLELPKEFDDILWILLNNWINISAQTAPTNNPKEFLSFCGTIGLGSYFLRKTAFKNEILIHLRMLANDSRWRIREAVAMALWKIVQSDPNNILEQFNSWLESKNWFEMRALAAGLAEPKILKDKIFAKKVLLFYKEILNIISEAKHEERKSESFKIMRKGLGYCLSVVVKEIPETGFSFMEELASMDNIDIKWILKENLKKNRLIKNFPQKVSYIKKLISN
ncbi:MAG: hypothetical protein ACFFEY_07895 [Candidatus Thorarchaeota archaeon]